MDIIPLITVLIELLVKLTGNKSLGESLQKKWAIYSNLPRLSVGFVGRKSETEKAHRALRSEYSLVSLEGPGGVGKTRLAIQVANECQQASRRHIWNPFRARFGAFVWVSDESQNLTFGGLLDAIALTLQETSLPQLPLEQKQHQVLQAMQKKSCLLVVDNFETVSDKEQIRQFLKNLPNKCKVLITSRERENFAEIVSLRIGELTLDEGLNLIRSEARRAGLSSLLEKSDDDLEALLQVTTGYPLAIKWALGQIKQEGQGLDEVTRALQTGHANIFQRMFDRSWGLLSSDARTLLVVLPLFQAPATLSALRAVSGLGDSTSTTLGTLVRMALVDASEQDLRNRRYTIHPLANAYLLNLPEHTQIKSVAIERMAEYFVELLDDYRDWRNEEVNYSVLEPDAANIYQTMNLCLDQAQYQAAYKILRLSVRYLFLQGSWDMLLAVTSRIVSAAQDVSDGVVAGHVLTWPITSIHRHRQQLDLALSTIAQAVDLLEKNKAIIQEEKILLDAWRQRGRALHEMGKRDDARIYLTKAYERYLELPGNEWNQLMLLLNLAELEIAQNRTEQADVWTQKAEILIGQFKDDERFATLALLKGQICLARMEYGVALGHFNRSLDIANHLKRQDSIADSYYWLAQAELATGDKKKARKDFFKAQAIYSTVGIQKRVQEIETLVANI